MALKGLLPDSPMRIVGVAIIVLLTIAIVNNVKFIQDLVRTR